MITKYFQGRLSYRSREALTKQNNEWLLKRYIKSFYNLLEDDSFFDGARAMIQVIIKCFINQ